MNKKDLIKHIGQELGYSQEQSSEIVNSVIICIRDYLEKGDDVLISGFGKFCVKDKAARRAKDPNTGEDIMIAPRRVVTFRCSGILRNKINGNQ